MLSWMMAAALAVAPPVDDGAQRMAAERQAMSALAWMDGEWRGTATTKTPSGDHKVVHTERIGTLLGGTIRLVEGHAYRADGSTGFNALGMIRFDPDTKTYRMASHAEGRFGDYALVPTADGYSWSIPAGPMTIKYTATLKNGVWVETGERLMPGRPAIPFFRMEMRRLGASAWPAGKPVGPR